MLVCDLKGFDGREKVGKGVEGMSRTLGHLQMEGRPIYSEPTLART